MKIFRMILGNSFLMFIIGTVMSAEAPLRQDHVPAELRFFVDARTAVDQSLEELIAAFPKLRKNFAFSEDQRMLPGLLQKVGQNVEAFFRNFPNTTSVENIVQDVLRSDGRLADRTRSKYNYLMTTRLEGGVGLDEYRTDPKGKEAKQDVLMRGFMQSSLCVWHLVHFHPFYQSDSRYRYLGRTSSPPAYVIAFAQKPESAREVARVGVWAPDVPNRRVLILLQGLVWVNPANYQIVRAQTELVTPRYDVGLIRNTTEVEYVEVRFDGVAQPLWLPRGALVTTTFRGSTFKNRHSYTDYQLFTVEAQDKVNPPVPP